jgi:hypothetical protein
MHSARARMRSARMRGKENNTDLTVFYQIYAFFC